jgi:hypothetical protein
MFLFIFKVDFIIQVMLGISQILDGPIVFLGVRIFLGKFGVNDLLLSLSHDILLLSFSKTLEVIWHKSMWSKLRLCGLLILGHDIRHIGSENLRLIGLLLIHLPHLLSLLFISSQLLVIIG